MGVTNKLIIAVALFTALCVGLTFSVGAIRVEVVNPTDYLIAVNLKLYNNDTLVYDKDSLTGFDLYPSSIVVNSSNNNFSINTYYYLRFPNEEDPNDDNYVAYDSATVDIFKFWHNSSIFDEGESDVDQDTRNFLSEDILISKISCWMIFGFTDGISSSVDPFVPIPIDSFSDPYLLFGNGVLDPDLYKDTISIIGNYGHRLDTNSGRYYSYRAFKVEYTLLTPTAPPSDEPSDYCCIAPISLSNLEGWNGLNYLVGCDKVDVEYYYRDEYEAGILNSNKETVFELSSRADDIISSLDVARPDQSVVDNLLDDDYISIVNDFQNQFGLYSKLPDGNFKNFITYSISSVIAIAFIGYALHGKRG